MQTKAVAFFIPDLRAGGAEKATALIANAMASQGYEVDVVTINGRGEFAALLAVEIKLIDLSARRFSQSVIPLARYLRSRKPLALYSQMFETAVFAASAIALARTNTKLCSTIRSTTSQVYHRASWKRKITAWLAKQVHRHFVDEIVAVSESVKADFSAYTRVPLGSITVIKNPIDPNIYELAQFPVDHPWLAQDIPAFVSVGSLKHEKGFDVLLQALAIARERVDAKLIIVGEGRLRSMLSQLAADLKVAGAVDFIGFDSNPYRYMAHASAFVLSSRLEGHPNVLVEASALGVPCIATDCPSGPREILDGGASGILVPVDDSAALAAALISHYTGLVRRNSTEM